MMKNNKNQLQAFSLIELSIVVLIIGLIVAGVLGGKKLVELSSLSKARTLTNSSPVNGIEDLVFWFETTSKDSIPPAQAIDGTTITTWYNLNPQMNNKNNLIQGGTYSGPVYRTATINSLPS